jgi:2-polyprenyl-6-methoxyphenol hydroxylase-like FAD-dependent oxidoreductase
MNRFVVVGAGPAGLSLAYLLSSSCHAVTLVDSTTSFRRQFRGDALMPCGLEALSHMGLSSLLAELPQRPLQGWSVWLEGRPLFQANEPMGSLQPCTLVPQAQLLEALLERALQQPSLQWLPGRSVQRLLHDDTPEARIRGVQLSDGQCLQANLVVGCDGRQSLVRRQAGLKLRNKAPGLDLLWFELPGPLPSGHWECFNTLVAGGAIGSACLGANGSLQLAWLLQPGAAVPKHEPAGWARRLAALMPAPMAAVFLEHADRLQGPRRVSVEVGLVECWHRPGLLLLGDAAHPMSPVRAQGINMALRDSLVAAHWLGRSSAAELDHAAMQVERLRRPEIERMQRLQQSEASQGHRIGNSALLRHSLARLSPVLGPLAQRVWMQRQKPLRQGLAGALPAAALSP